MPKVSVGIAVYNGEEFVGRAIDSVLGQTFKDLEVIIIDDGSTDRTLEIARRFKDERITVLSNDRNEGVSFTRNRYLELARGEYVAILDADDEWYADKLEKQVDFLDSHTGVGACGSYVQRMNPGKHSYCWKYPLHSDEIRIRLLWGSSVVHSSLVFRKAVLEKFDVRYTDQKALNGVEDYMILTQLIQYTRIENIPHALLNYFEHDEQFTTKSNKELISRSLKVCTAYVGKTLGIDLAGDRYTAFSKAFVFDFTFSYDELLVLRNLFQDIYEENQKAGFFDPALLAATLRDRWYQCCYHSSLPAKNKLQAFYRSGFLTGGAGWLKQFRLIMKAVFAG